MAFIYLLFEDTYLSKIRGNKMDKFELVRFTDNGFELDVRADLQHDTVWLTQKEMSLLFDVSSDNIGLHIKTSSKMMNWTLQHPRIPR